MDPVLQALAASQHIQGLQAQGVIATAKHLIGYEQEEDRGGPFETPLSANIDDRTLHELYLWPFAEAVRAGVGAVMTSYNMVFSFRFVVIFFDADMFDLGQRLCRSREQLSPQWTPKGRVRLSGVRYV